MNEQKRAAAKFQGRVFPSRPYKPGEACPSCGAVIADMLLSAPPKCVECWGWLAPPLHPSPADQIEAP
jgi:hypothetical protein